MVLEICIGCLMGIVNHVQLEPTCLAITIRVHSVTIVQQAAFRMMRAVQNVNPVTQAYTVKLERIAVRLALLGTVVLMV